MYDPTPKTLDSNLTVQLQRDDHGRLTDGRHVFWLDTTTTPSRVRWSRNSTSDWPDDGLGVVSHGAAPTIRAAVVEAHRHARILETARQDLAGRRP